jgi:hypothetical protein
MDAAAWGDVATSVGVVVAIGLGVFNSLQNRKLANETRRLDRRKENRQELWEKFDRAENLLKDVRRQLRSIGHQAEAEFAEFDPVEVASMTRAFQELKKAADPELSTPRSKGVSVSLLKPPLYRFAPAWQRAAEA